MLLHAAVFVFTCLLDVGFTLLCTSDGVVTFGHNNGVGHVVVPVPEEYTDGSVFNVSVMLSLPETYFNQGVDLDYAESLEVTETKLRRRQPVRFVLAFPGSVPEVTEVKVNQHVVCTSQLSDAPYNRLRGRSARSSLEVSKAVVPTGKSLNNDNIVFPGMTNKHDSSRNFGPRQNFRQSFNKCPWSSDREENDCTDLFWVDSTGTGALRVPVPSQRNPDSAVHSTAFFVAAGSLTEQDVRAAGLQLDEPLASVLSRLRAGANDIRYTVQLPSRAPCVQLISLHVNGQQVCSKNDAVPPTSYTNFSLWHQVYHSTPVNQPPLPPAPTKISPTTKRPPTPTPALTTPEPTEETKPVHVQLHLVFRSSQALQAWLSNIFGVDLNLAGRQSSNAVRVLKLSTAKV